MENKHLEIVNRTLEQVEGMKAELERVKKELEEEYDALSFNGKCSIYADELQYAMKCLEDAVWGGIEPLEDELKSAVSSLETLPTCDRGEIEQEEDDLVEDEEFYDMSEEYYGEGAYVPYVNNESNSSGFSKILGAGMFLGSLFRSKGNNQFSKRDDYDPYDLHWGNHFDWKDENNDGYDDRDDGFWMP